MRASRRELALVTSATALLSALFVLLASVHGAFGAARNDDWSYFRVAFDFARTRHFRVDGWIQTMLVGHTLLAWPVVERFGDSIKALQLVCVVAGAVGIVCCYALLRRFLTPAWAALACLTLALGPVFASLAVSYMTDATAFAAQMITLLLGVRAIESRAPLHRRWWLGAAALCGFAAFSIREYALIAFPVVFVVVLARAWRDDRERAWLVGIGIVFVAAALVLFGWRRSIPRTVAPAIDTRPGPADVRDLLRFATTLGLFASPAVLVLSPVRTVTRAWAAHRGLTMTAIGVGVLGVLMSGAGLIGNYVTSAGSYPAASVVHTALPIVPHDVFLLARLLGAYALVMGLLVLARACADVAPVLAERRMLRSFTMAATAAPALTTVILFATTLVVVYAVVIAATTETFFDRYLIPLVPLVAALLVVAGLRYDLLWPKPTIAAGLAIVMVALVGFVYVDAAATVDGAKWRAAERLASAGFRPSTIDAGYEWFGFHQRGPVVPESQRKDGDLATRLFTPRPVCATVVLNGTEAGARTVARDATVVFRTVERTLLGRRVILTAIRGPSRCGATS